MTYSIKNFNRPMVVQPSIESIELKSHGYNKFQYFQKRAIDFIASGSLLLITLPIMLYSIYRIKKESPGSILFKQLRIGKDGKPFTCYKFRSMYTNSQFNPYTVEGDDRIFPYGNTMRKMRIDELPQLFNILKGEMHLIGPRAEWNILVEDYEKIIPNYQQRHDVAPGITGLAQVSYPYGANIKDTEEKLKYDLKYITNWSILKEFTIMYKTVLVVLGKKGL